MKLALLILAGFAIVVAGATLPAAAQSYEEEYRYARSVERNYAEDLDVRASASLDDDDDSDDEAAADYEDDRDDDDDGISHSVTHHYERFEE